jgi:hypothetical protein
MREPFETRERVTGPPPPLSASMQAQQGSPFHRIQIPPSIPFPLPNPHLQQLSNPLDSVELVDWGIDDDKDEFVPESWQGCPPEQAAQVRLLVPGVRAGPPPRSGASTVVEPCDVDDADDVLPKAGASPREPATGLRQGGSSPAHRHPPLSTQI